MKVPQKLTIVSQLTLKHYCIVTFIINGIFVSKKGKPPPAFVDNIASVIVTNHHSQWSYNYYHHLQSRHDNHLQKHYNIVISLKAVGVGREFLDRVGGESSGSSSSPSRSSSSPSPWYYTPSSIFIFLMVISLIAVGRWSFWTMGLCNLRGEGV